jgi:hypothetical protein
MNTETEEAHNQKYQRWLAMSLVSSLGYEEAVMACQRMQWYGVLRCLLNENGANVATSADQPSLEEKAA